jgi:hypothetical protein
MLHMCEVYKYFIYVKYTVNWMKSCQVTISNVVRNYVYTYIYLYLPQHMPINVSYLQDLHVMMYCMCATITTAYDHKCYIFARFTSIICVLICKIYKYCMCDNMYMYSLYLFIFTTAYDHKCNIFARFTSIVCVLVHRTVHRMKYCLTANYGGFTWNNHGVNDRFT